MDAEMRLRVDQMVEDLRTELYDRVPQWSTIRTPPDLFDTEEEMQALLNRLHTRIVGCVLDAIHRDRTFVAECRAQALSDRGARNNGWKLVSIRTLGGTRLQIRTPYSISSLQKKTGVYPVLRRLGIVKGNTPRFLSEINRQMVDGPSGAEVHERLAGRGIAYAKSSLWRPVRDLASIALWQRQVALTNLDQTETIVPGPLAGKRVVVSLDGGRLHVRVNNKSDPKIRHSVTKLCEPKLFVIYTIDEKGNRERKGELVYDGTIQSAEHIFALLKLRLKQLGIAQAKILVILGDGSPWIWKGAAELRSDLGMERIRVIEIVDWAHMAEKLSEAAKLWTKEYSRQQDWFKRMRKLLKAGQVDQVITALLDLDQGKAKGNRIRKIIEYFQTHQTRMHYEQYQAEGLPIGSGVIESGIRRIVNLRLKGASIFWKPENAEGILYLRCQIKSGKWVAFVKSALAEWAADMTFSLDEVHQVRKQIAASYVESHPHVIGTEEGKQATKWARKLIETGDALIIDTETTGLNHCDEVIQLAILNLKGDVLLDTLFKPTVPVTPEAHAIHGIADQDLQDARNFAELYEQVANVIRKKTLIAYNADFDRRVLGQTYGRYGLQMPEIAGWYCVMEKYAAYWGESHDDQAPKWQSLEAACLQQGISTEGAHKAARDCRLTMELIKAMSLC